MTDLNQALIQLNNQLKNQFTAKETSRNQQMNQIVDEYKYLVDLLVKSLQRCGLCKNRYQFAKLLNLQPNFCYDVASKRLHPKLKDIANIQLYITNILTNLNQLLDEYSNKQVIRQAIERISDRYTALYIQAQQIYLH